MTAASTPAIVAVSFAAIGTPRTKGSMVFVTRRYARNSSEATAPWQAVMAHAAYEARRALGIADPTPAGGHQ